jgi:hypothetical protein
MAGKNSIERREIVESGSPLKGHSLGSKNMRNQRAGFKRLFGQDSREISATAKRMTQKEERRQALYDSVIRVLEGNPSEEDVLTVVLHIDEFEKVDPEVLGATIVDFTGLTPSDARIGEPEFFRKG